MTQLSAEQLTAVQSLQQRVSARITTDPAVRQQLGSLGDFLIASENQLIALMNNTAPPASGDIEFGMVLYWIHNDLPDDTFFNWLASQFPPTQITATMYAQWQVTWSTTGVIAPDGTMVADGTFSQLDRGWLYAAILYILGIAGEITPATFGSTPQTIMLPNNSVARIAIIGDWGTGSWNDCGTQGPATALMQQLQQLSPPPDVIVHLGDVYYAGTGSLSIGINTLMILISAKIGVPYVWNEDAVSLVQSWWSNGKVPISFTLNSNHEMYSGANGYFGDGLSSPVFQMQKNTSYFVIYYQDWAILGLDSSYFSSSFFYMQGALQSMAQSDQVAWVQKLDLQGKNIIALTHHTALSVDGLPIAKTQLYDDMYAALNNQDPDYWYWGHIHNGVVYNNKASMSPNRQTKTACRCMGHSALPFGNAYFWQNGTKYNLDQSSYVDYYAHTPLPNPNNCPQRTYRVKNGFAVLTLSQGTIQEAFYEQDNPSPVWKSPPVRMTKKAGK